MGASFINIITAALDLIFLHMRTSTKNEILAISITNKILVFSFIFIMIVTFWRKFWKFLNIYVPIST